MSQVGQPGYPLGNALFPTSTGTAATKPIGHNEAQTEGALGAKFNTSGAVIGFAVGAQEVIVISSDAPNDADGRPDGTIYFQV